MLDLYNLEKKLKVNSLSSQGRHQKKLRCFYCKMHLVNLFLYSQVIIYHQSDDLSDDFNWYIYIYILCIYASVASMHLVWIYADILWSKKRIINYCTIIKGIISEEIWEQDIQRNLCTLNAQPQITIRCVLLISQHWYVYWFPIFFSLHEL